MFKNGVDLVEPERNQQKNGYLFAGVDLQQFIFRTAMTTHGMRLRGKQMHFGFYFGHTCFKFLSLF
jgi:hypothetical protein